LHHTIPMILRLPLFFALVKRHHRQLMCSPLPILFYFFHTGRSVFRSAASIQKRCFAVPTRYIPFPLSFLLFPPSPFPSLSLSFPFSSTPKRISRCLQGCVCTHAYTLTIDEATRIRTNG
jgi:hypothetical protein